MSKKNKKLKEKLFSKDYSKITAEEQQRMNDIAFEIMNGNYDVYDQIPVEETKEEEIREEVESESGFAAFLGDMIAKSSMPETPVAHVDLLPEETNDLMEGIHEMQDKKTYSLEEDLGTKDEDDILDGLRVTPSEKEETPSRRVYSAKEIMKMTGAPDRLEYKEDTKEDSEVYDNQDSEISENTEENEEELEEAEDTIDEGSIDDVFRVLTADEESGDFIIADPFKQYKSHTINFYNLIEARTNYEASNVYNGMVRNIPFALAFIAGPILVVRQGNEMFQNFISTVESYDKNRLFILSRTEESEDAEGNEIIDFLVFYVDSYTTAFVTDFIKDLEKDDSELAIDFLYAVYKKAMDRYENPWSVIDYIDNYIEDEESQPEDMEYVMNLIIEDDDTNINVKLDRPVDEFMKEFTRPIENYIDPNKGIFTKNCKMLKAFIEDRQCPVDSDGVLIIPENFQPVKNIGAKPQVKKTGGQVTQSVKPMVQPASQISQLVYSSGRATNTPFKDKLKDFYPQPEEDTTKTEEVKPEETHEIDEVDDMDSVEITVEKEETKTEEKVVVNPAQEVVMENAVKPEVPKTEEAPATNGPKQMKRFGGTMVVKRN